MISNASTLDADGTRRAVIASPYRMAGNVNQNFDCAATLKSTRLSTSSAGQAMRY